MRHTSRLFVRLLTCALAGGIFSSVSLAEEDGGDRDGRHFRHRPGGCRGEHRAAIRRHLLEKFDADGDGELNDEERAAARAAREERRGAFREAILNRFDADGDGELSDEERAAVRAAREERREAFRQAMLEKFDADGDGVLNEDERAAAHEARRQRLLGEFDADGDGELSDEERAAARQAMRERRRQALLGENDANPAEAVNFPAQFLRGDVNTDGNVDISDSASVLAFLFLGDARPRCMDAADANDDGAVDLSDSMSILERLFRGSDPLPAPYPSPGLDPTGDGLTCETTSA